MDIKHPLLVGMTLLEITLTYPVLLSISCRL
nr:MAG TPA: hypothetical protein [Caudoviricetes sp.]